MDYIEYMHNLRKALRIVAEKIPEVLEVAEMRAQREMDQDLEIALLPDMAFYILEKKYEEIAPKIYQFNPEDEYGVVRTMWDSEMRGQE